MPTKNNAPEIKYTTVFEWNKTAYDKGYKLIINQGASSSGKTIAILQNLILIAASNRNKEIQICGLSHKKLARGAMKDFIKLMKEQFQIWNTKSWNITHSKYTFSSGSYIEFFPIEDADIARGPRRDICFINEANLITKGVYEQLRMRTKEVMWVDFNPADNQCYLYSAADLAQCSISSTGTVYQYTSYTDKHHNGQEIFYNSKKEEFDPKICFIKSTYLNNELIPKESEDFILSLTPDQFRIWGLGERGLLTESIYKNFLYGKDECEIQRDEDGEILGDVWYALDFNFSAEPCAMLRIVQYQNKIYLDEMLYEPLKALSDLLREFNKFKEFTKYDPIYADTAGSAFIEEIRRNGYNIKKSKKDVNIGISFVQNFTLYITKRSENLLSEIQSYRWILDDEGQPTDKPIKKKNHLMDCLRYGLYTKLTQRTRDFSSLNDINGL